MRTGIEVSSHDPLPNCTDVLFHVSSSLVISLYLMENPYIRPKVVEIPFEIRKRISFEELVTDINNNRLQEVVNKRLYLIVPVMTSIV